MATPTKLLTADGGTAQHVINLYLIEVDGCALTVAEFDISAWPLPAHKSPRAPQLGAIAGPLGRELLETSSVPMVLQSVDTIIFANRAARDHLGVSEPTELEGQPILSIVHPDGLFSTIQRVAFVFAAHQPLHSVPTKLRCADGRVLHVTADAYPVKASGHWAAILVTRSYRESDPEPE